MGSQEVKEPKSQRAKEPKSQKAKESKSIKVKTMAEGTGRWRECEGAAQ